MAMCDPLCYRCRYSGVITAQQLVTSLAVEHYSQPARSCRAKYSELGINAQAPKRRVLCLYERADITTNIVGRKLDSCGIHTVKALRNRDVRTVAIDWIVAYKAHGAECGSRRHHGGCNRDDRCRIKPTR